jgi:hypothetical protein
MTTIKPQTNSKRQVFFYEDGDFIAEVPSLPGCISVKTRTLLISQNLDRWRTANFSTGDRHPYPLNYRLPKHPSC